MPTAPSLTLSRRLKASPEKVFRAWTDPQKLMIWFGPARIQMIKAECDPKIGGRYSLLARSPEGEEVEVTGVYREVVPNAKLVFTWAWRSTPERQSLVTITLKPDGTETLLTLTHEQLFDQDALERHRHGWMGSLDKLERLVA